MLRSALHSPRFRLAVPIVVFLVLALVQTWPWAIHPGSRISAPLGGDVSSGIAKFGVYAREHTVPWLPGSLDSVAFPVGLEKTPGIDGVSFVSATALWVASMTIGPIATNGLHSVLGYLLTAVLTMLFVRRVTGSMIAGTVAGLAYGFFPHMTVMAYVAVTYQQMWLFVLPLWALWEFTRRPTRRWALLAGLATAVAIFWTPYYAEHATVVLLSGMVAVALLAKRLGARRRTVLWALVPVGVAGVLQVAIGALTAFEDQPARPLSDFYEQSAHPLMYLLPGYGSSWTRAGSGATDWSYDLLVDLVPRAASTNLYVGLTVVALAIVALAKVVIPWVRHRSSELQQVGTAGVLAVAVVVGTFVFSLPPKLSVLGIAVPLPGYVVYELAPGLRAGQRFAMPLMAGMAILAGIGAWQLVRGRSVRRAALVGVALCAVLLVDHRATRSDQWVPAPPETPALRALAAAPDGPVLNWASSSGFVGGDPQRACFLQAYHHKPVFSACAIQNWPIPQLQVANLPPCDGVLELREKGLRYLVQEPMSPDVAGACMRDDERLNRARMLARDDSYIVWDLSPARPGRRTAGR